MGNWKDHANHTATRVLPEGQTGTVEKQIPSEVPVALTYNGVSHVVMMVTPTNLEDFALGFSLSEEIVEDAKEIQTLKIVEVEKGFVAQLKIPKNRFKALLERDRNLVGQTGCGLCGVAEIDDAVRGYSPIETKPETNADALFKALRGLRDHQPLSQKTAAVHGAAFVAWDGEIVIVREDVGRHNAFDKLIGAMAKSNQNFTVGFALLTSRCSFELVQKALAMKIPMVATISAPTDLAIRLAKDHKLTLITVARRDAVQVNNDPYNIF